MWFNVSSVVVFNPLGNLSFYFTNIVIITCFFRTLPRVNYIMFVCLILKCELRLLPVKEIWNFMFLDNNLFTVFITDLITCSPFFSLIWYHKEMFFAIIFFNYCLVTGLCGLTSVLKYYCLALDLSVYLLFV